MCLGPWFSQTSAGDSLDTASPLHLVTRFLVLSASHAARHFPQCHSPLSDPFLPWCLLLLCIWLSEGSPMVAIRSVAVINLLTIVLGELYHVGTQATTGHSLLVVLLWL